MDSENDSFYPCQVQGVATYRRALFKIPPSFYYLRLILSSVVSGKAGSLPQIKWLDFLAVFPTGFVAFRYRNLVGTVLFGVVLIAILRLVF